MNLPAYCHGSASIGAHATARGVRARGIGYRLRRSPQQCAAPSRSASGELVQSAGPRHRPRRLIMSAQRPMARATVAVGQRQQEGDSALPSLRWRRRGAALGSGRAQQPRRYAPLIRVCPRGRSQAPSWLMGSTAMVILRHFEGNLGISLAI